MKKKRLLIIIAIVLVLILAAGISVFVVVKNNKYTRIAFYGLDEKYVASIQKTLSAVTDQKGNPVEYEFTVLDADTALVPQLNRKYDAVYTYMSLNAKNAVASVKEKQSDKVCLREDLLKDTTISVKETALYNEHGLLSAVPFLLDYYQIDIDRTILFGLGIKTIATWNDIDNYANAAKKEKGQAILFDAKNSSNFLGMIGALTESLSGVASVDKAVSGIRSLYEDKDINVSRDAFDLLIESLSEMPGAPLYESTHTLARWFNNGVLSKDAFNFNSEDVRNYVSMEMAPIVFEKISQRRTIKFPATQNISSIYYPSERNPVTRKFAAPVFTAIPLSSKQSVKAGIELIVSKEAQENLSRETGLAPVLANCYVPDHQADDVRYWIAATNAPSIPFGEAAFCEQASRDLFAESLIAYIKSLK